MLLQKLREYYVRHPAPTGDVSEPPPEYKVLAIPWIIRLDSSGGQPHLIRTSGRVSRAGRDAGKEFAAPFLRRSGTRIKPQLLADKAEFVLGVVGESAERAVSRHAEFVALVEACARETKVPDVTLVLNFLRHLPNSLPELPADLTAREAMTFEVDGRRPIDLPEVREFWARIAPRLRQKGMPTLDAQLVISWQEGSVPSESGLCIVCGEERPIARIHPLTIRLPRSVSDQQVSIVSANKDAFWSYGLEQSLLAPTCTRCAEAYGRALNQLVGSEANSIVVHSSVFVFWTREQTNFNFRTMLSDPRPEDVRELIASVRSGRLDETVDAGEFYAVSLSASGGRAVVRDWVDTTVAEAKRNLVRWFERQRIVGPNGEEPTHLGLYALAFATVREAKDLSPLVPRALVRTALAGAPVPPGLLFQAVKRNRAEAVKRNRAEQRVTRARAALIKLVLVGDVEKEEDAMVELDPEHSSPAYRCGRLLAVLEQAQRLAIPGIGATIVDRFFGTASSAPASVFPRLLRGAQPHLAKLERDRPGAFIALQRRLEDIQAGIPASGFPRTLSLHDQGLFALGYYHQRAFDRAQAREASKRKGGRGAPEAELMPANGEEEEEER
jgi:CRISPR-associated protein Csd1